MAKSPVVILFDTNGNALAVSPGVAIPGGTTGLIAMGSDGTNARYMRTANDGTVRVDPTGTTTQPISAASLPLPTGAATEATITALLTLAGFQARINTFGQKAMAASTPVVIASDQAAIPVNLTLTSIEIGTVDQGTGGSSAWKVDGSAVTQPISALSLPLPAGAATEATLANVLTTAALQARINTQGQKAMAASTPVVIASDQSTLTISNSSVTILNPSITVSNSSVTVLNASLTVNATSLPLPTGAATEATLATILTTAAFQARINTFGQKAMAASTPVVIASDQSTLTISNSSVTVLNPSITVSNSSVTILNASITVSANSLPDIGTKPFSTIKCTSLTVDATVVQVTPTALTNRKGLILKAVTTTGAYISIGEVNTVTISGATAGFLMGNGDAVTLDANPSMSIYAIGSAVGQMLYILEAKE